ncbi:MAG: prolyl oligopeptidase family serine peptidase [Pseudomonadota bacterium]
MNTKAQHTYGHWPSPVDARELFQGTETISAVSPGQQGVFFLLSMPEEANAQALMYLSPQGQRIRVSPPGFNLRSQVHEYGSMPYTVSADAVFYCNFSDQRLYRQAFEEGQLSSSTPVAITPVPEIPRALRYADLIVDAQRQRLICVREDHRDPSAEPRNTLVAIPLRETSNEAAGAEHPGDILFEDSDFVGSPSLSADGNLLAFQSWSHPAMPWDITQIQVCQFDAEGKLIKPRSVCPEQPGALQQPRFSPQGDLTFIADWNDWWNLYRISAAALQQADSLSTAEALFPMEAELCGPQWQLGAHSYAHTGEDAIVLGMQRDCRWHLALLDLRNNTLQMLHENLGLLENIYWHNGRALYWASTDSEPGAIFALTPPSKPTDISAPQQLFQGRSSVTLTPDNISSPEHFRCVKAYGLYYPPRNALYEDAQGGLPPLLVSVHGGPTGSAKAAFNAAVQFWTTRGFAWLDVNHRGSAGYGRRFRQSLYGQWGVVDIEDVIDAVQHLIDKGAVDPARIAIRGGSAGGYVVLAALAASNLLRAGVSYYGISDLERLAQDTHKFESRYLDQLIGPYPEQAAVYRQRSPLRHIDKINAPVLLLQGLLDKVVPPDQSEKIYRQLRDKNPLSEYLCFANEGHGFRDPVNQIAALETEQAFYQRCIL